ncbi:MucBP domain-containing protein, partial [Klebsiella pneumoniae]|uniref:MucBP domain-containing protein n=1 Tax=Klebsiella pneumoniae TaxID=573 RepID=UPI00191A2DE1
QSFKDIPAYTLVGTEIDENGNVKHIYKKSEVPAKNITTEWLDENGNPLKDPTTGETPETAGSFDGYEFVGTTTDENGNVKHVFKKVVKTTTNWVDENGNPLKPQTDGSHEPGVIPDYEFVGTATDANGNVIH